MKNDPKLNTDWIISAEELTSWAQLRDANQPALTGSPKWRNYVAFLEKKLLEYGVVDNFRNSWPFERWYTSDDATNWSLISDGQPVRVSHYDAYSGSTGPPGITAQLVYYDHDNPPQSLKNKIVVFPTIPHPQPPYDDEYLMYSTFNDYEYRSDDHFAPLFSYVDPAYSITFDTMYQLEQQFHEIAMAGGAAGLIKYIERGVPTTAIPTFTGATYLYDGDGNMVKSVVNGVTTFYAGRHYQVEVDGGDTTIRKYYAAGGQMIAVRTKVNLDPSVVNWILGDHLGSSNVTANEDGDHPNQC
ncbi:MAG: hypothetical protein FVQ83_16530 [Chloroflexi bacterium]|nr:hypothetical protein [Chloroflexota bacterium]